MYYNSAIDIIATHLKPGYWAFFCAPLSAALNRSFTSPPWIDALTRYLDNIAAAKPKVRLHDLPCGHIISQAVV
jgi:hypothetical protein